VSVLFEHFSAAWRDHALAPRRGRLVVGVSGGLDSVVLLHLLQRLSRTAPLQLELVVAHANHQLREEADGEARFVQGLAAGLGLRWVTDCLPVREEMARTRESVEMAARRLRHGFLARVALENGARQIALAHHADDQAELFFLRLLRGAGGEGLGGMKPASPSPADPRLTLIRPLLGFTKAKLAAYAGAEGLEFCEDASNRDRGILRNRIRHELLPLLSNDYSPGICEHVRRTGELVADEADFAQQAADRWLKARRRTAFARLHVAVQRAVIRRQLWELGHAGEFELVERLRRETAAVTAPTGTRIRRDEAGRLDLAIAPAPTGFLTADREIALTGERGQADFAGVRLRWRLEAVSPPKTRVGKKANEERLDASRVGRRVRLRHWQPGDRFQPLGLGRPSKLQNLFVNRKVPAAQRRSRLVAEAENGELCWVEGLPPGEAFKLTPATNRVLVLSWQHRAGG
jgi:tRNA(Ile)-lysidine synthase